MIINTIIVSEKRSDEVRTFITISLSTRGSFMYNIRCKIPKRLLLLLLCSFRNNKIVILFF